VSATPTDGDSIDFQELRNAALKPRNGDNADILYRAVRDGWDLPEVPIGDGMSGIPISRFARKLYESHEENADDPNNDTLAERLYGAKHPFLAGMLVGPEYENGSGVSDFDRVLDHSRNAAPDSERALIDEGVVKDASPVIVDPEIYSILRSNAPILDIIPTVQQAGFTAQYNVFDQRTLNDFFMTETDAADLTDNTASDFRLQTETRDMQIMATLIDVGDFSQRAEASLDYMDLMDTTVGQVMQEWFIQKALTYIYGDSSSSPSATAAFESTEGFDGLAKISSDAGNTQNKTSVGSGRLEDMLDVLTEQTQSSSLTFGNARYLVSPAFYNTIYDEVTPVVRIDGYDADVEYGPQGLAIGHERGSVPITPCDNIRDVSSDANNVGKDSTDGDVFLYDERAVQFRALLADSTIPLARIGLADRAALACYGTLIDKTLETTSTTNANTHRLRYGDV